MQQPGRSKESMGLSVLKITTVLISGRKKNILILPSPSFYLNNSDIYKLWTHHDNQPSPINTFTHTHPTIKAASVKQY